MKLIKWLLWLILFLVVIAVGGAIFLVSTVDPNDLKPQISRQVESATGRQLHLGGDLAWQFYPWVGVTVNDFALSNREGFSPPNMLEAGQVDVQIRLLPLLSKQLEIGKVVLQSPNISLSVNAAGETNWDDLAGGGASTAPAQPEAEAGAMLGGLVIQGVDISNGQISWDDQSAGQQYRLDDVNLFTGSIAPGVPVDFQLSTGISGTDLPAPATLEIEGSILLGQAMETLNLSGVDARISMDQASLAAKLEALDYELNKGLIKATGLAVDLSEKSLDLQGEVDLGTLDFDVDGGLLNVDRLTYTGRYQAYPFSGETSAVRFDLTGNRLELGKQTLGSEYNGVAADLQGQEIQLDLARETLMAPALQMNIGEAVVEAGVKVTDLMGDLEATGRLVSNSFNPRQLVEALGMQDLLPELPQPALQSLSLQTGFTGGLNAIALDELSVMLDRSTLTGNFSLADFNQPAYRFDLALDRINVDDYLPESQQEVAQEAGPAAVVALPFAELKGLDVQGQVAIGELRVLDLVSNEVLVRVDAGADRIEVSPLNAQVLGGKLENRLVYDIAGAVPAVEIDTATERLDLGQLLRTLQVTDRFDGLGAVKAALTSRGLDADAAVANLNGSIDIRMSDGAIRGVDIQKTLIKTESAISSLVGKDLGLSTDLGDKTEFSEFSGKIKVTDGIMAIRDIDLKAPAIRVGGGGTVDLVKQQLDMKLDVSVVGSFEGQGGATVDKLKGQTIPMKISGPLSDPSILPDVSKILKGEVEKKLTEKLGGDAASGQSLEDTLKGRLNDKLSEKLGGAAAGAAATETAPASPTKSEPNADIFSGSGAGSDAPAASGNADIFEEPEQAPAPSQPQEKPSSVEDQLKEELKGKLLKGLFGG